MPITTQVCTDLTATEDALGRLRCEDSWVTVELALVSDIGPTDPGADELDLAVLGSAFSAGFFIVASWWVLTFGVKAAVAYIRGLRR